MPDHRLPRHVLPRHYTLELAPDLSAHTFTGTVAIDVEVVEATDQIILNAADLVIEAASILVGGERRHVSVSADESAERLVLTVEDRLQPGTARLEMAFTGELNDRLHGFYRSTYQTPEGEKRTLATTQFEATDARRAFPCWDDPAVKATFQVTLIIPSDSVAISNTLVESETPQDGSTKAVRFAETPRMSTYLLAFVVGDLASVEDTAPGGTRMRVWATRGTEELGRFARAVVVWCQEESENMGGWTFIDRRLENLMVELKMPALRPRYVGRPASAAPATGLMKRHLQEQKALVEDALTLPAKQKARI